MIPSRVNEEVPVPHQHTIAHKPGPAQRCTLMLSPWSLPYIYSHAAIWPCACSSFTSGLKQL